MRYDLVTATALLFPPFRLGTVTANPYFQPIN